MPIPAESCWLLGPWSAAPVRHLPVETKVAPITYLNTYIFDCIRMLKLSLLIPILKLDCRGVFKLYNGHNSCELLEAMPVRGGGYSQMKVARRTTQRRKTSNLNSKNLEFWPQQRMTARPCSRTRKAPAFLTIDQSKDKARHIQRLIIQKLSTL